MINSEKSEHDLSSKGRGKNYGVTEVRNGGQAISLYGWHRGIEEGDFLILKNKEDTTRYLVKTIRYERDPADMWFAEAEFAPREFSEE
jgi:hypothetical protein